MPLWSRCRRVTACVLVLHVVVLAACDSDSTGHGKSPTGALAHVRWVVPSALAATGSLLNIAAATDSVFVVSGVAELVGYAASDGRVLWKRRDVPTREPLAVDDSMIVALAAGPSVALRARDGQLIWRATVPGDAFTTMPIQVGEHALTTNAMGDVFAVRLATGAVRIIGTMATLAGAPGQVWAFAKLGGDTALVVSQLETDQGRGAIVVARILVASGTLLGRATLPFARNEFLSTQAPYVQDSLLILPTTGRVIAMNYRSGRRAWTVVDNSVALAVRDGEVYSVSGTGTLAVLEATTGRIVRNFGEILPGAITDVYPCREGIVFTGGGVWIIQNVPGARAKLLSSDLFSLLFPKSGTLYSSAWTREIAVRCT